MKNSHNLALTHCWLHLKHVELTLQSLWRTVLKIRVVKTKLIAFFLDDKRPEQLYCTAGRTSGCDERHISPSDTLIYRFIESLTVFKQWQKCSLVGVECFFSSWSPLRLSLSVFSSTLSAKCVPTSSYISWVSRRCSLIGPLRLTAAASPMRIGWALPGEVTSALMSRQCVWREFQ